MAVQVSFKPFAEQVEFFRKKINVPTERWDGLWKEHHAHGFMVAGVTKQALLEDLRRIVDDAQAGKVGFDEFQRRFEETVKRAGWVPNQGYVRRAKVIYETNIRQAQNAGRWRQMMDPDSLLLTPYVEYVHSPESKVPRIHHKAWNGLVLDAKDPWLHTHAPQNGWMCRCKLVPRSRRDLARMGKTAPDKAPAIEYREWKDKQGVVHKVPEGIDPGFDYNPGMASLSTKSAQAFGERVMQLPPVWRARAIADYKNRAIDWFDDVSTWVDDVLQTKTPTGGVRAIGYLPESILAREPKITNALVAVDDSVIAHFGRDAKSTALKSARADFLRDLPLAVGRYDAVLFDVKNNSYLLVRKVSNSEYATLVLRVDFKNNKSTPFGLSRLSWLRTVGQAKKRDLVNGFELIEGVL